MNQGQLQESDLFEERKGFMLKNLVLISPISCLFLPLKGVFLADDDDEVDEDEETDVDGIEG